MRHIYLKLVCAALPCWYAVAGETSLSELSDRVDELELNQSLNPIRFNGEVQARYDKISMHDENDATKPKLSSDIYRLRFRLDMTAAASKKLNFFGRFATSKAFNEFVNATDQNGNYTNVGGNDEVDGIESQSMSYRGPQVWLERAYFNYSLPANLTFSMGRLPTVEGSPLNLTYGTAEMGSYPLLGYSTTLDGFALTHNIGNLILRGIYHPTTLTARTGGNLPYPVERFNGKALPMSEDISVAMFDYTDLSMPNIAKKIQITGQYVLLKNWQIPDRSDVGDAVNAALAKTKTALDAKAALATQAGQTATATQLSTLSSIVGSLKSKGSSVSLGYQGIILYGEMSHIANTGLSLALTSHQTVVTSKGSMDLIVDDPTFKKLPSDITQNFEYFRSGIMTNKSSEKFPGKAVLSVLSYQLPVESLKNPTAGIEYFTTDKNYQFFNGDIIDPIGFLKVKGGTSKHIFYIQPIDTNFKMRIGYMSKKPKFQESITYGANKEMKVKKEKTTAYLEFLASF